MTARFGSLAALATIVTVCLLTSPAAADTTIVNETFDGYADTAAFKAVWVPTIGNGTAAAGAADQDAGILTNDPLTSPANFPGIQGLAVDHVGATASTPGMVNQFGGIINQGAGLNPQFSIAPSATQSVVLSYDMFVGTSGNERMSVGLRHINVVGTTVTTSNIVEMGVYNSHSANPFTPGLTIAPGNATPGNPDAVPPVPQTPGFYPGTGYATRTQSFGTRGSDERGQLVVQPDWQYFQLPTELDRTTDADELVSIGDIGAGWHRYTATITPTTVTYTIDLFRDDLRNTSITPDTETGIRPGTPGVDATLSFPISTTAAGFNALRIGGPSGLSSLGSGFIGFDNISLKLVDVVAAKTGPDFNNDGWVNGEDFLIWQANYGSTTATQPTGDASNPLDGTVDDADFAIWKAQFGNAAGVAVATGVPEPASAALAAVALAGLAASRRRRIG